MPSDMDIIRQIENDTRCGVLGAGFRNLVLSVSRINPNNLAPSRWRTTLDRRHHFARPHSNLRAVEWCERRLHLDRGHSPGSRFRRLLSVVWARIDAGTCHLSSVDWLVNRLAITVCTNCGHDVNGQRCSCYFCEGCDSWVESACSNCERCDRCCRCVVCPSCDERCNASSYCDGCSSCEDCGCKCSSQLTFHGEPSPTFPRYIGLEIECGCARTDRIHKVATWWGGKLDHDGSISFGHDLEFVTAPARGAKLEEQVRDVCDALDLSDAKVDTSCGLHVHVGAKDLTVSQLLTVARLYARVESGLYSIVAPSRRSGQYSGAWGSKFEEALVFDDAPLHTRKDRLDAAIYGSLSEAKRAEANRSKHSCRYHGLNFNSLILYGTLEFRLHHGTTNADKILNWAAVCTAIVEWAVHHDERDVHTLKGSSFGALCQVVKSRKVKEWVKARHNHFARMTERSFGVQVRPTVESMEAVREESES